jgi:hypothetical protein
MAYTRAHAERYVNRIRRYIDQVPFQDENVKEESEAEESVSTTLSDDFIFDTINSATQAIASRAKACHVYDAITKDSGTDLTTPSGVIIRLLYGSTKLNGNRAVFRNVDRARRLEDTGRAGTTSEPAYSYENGEIIFYPTPSSDTTEFRYVDIPTKVSALSDEVPLDERFEAAIVYYASAECFQRLRRMNLEQLARQQYEDEMTAYGLGARTSRLDQEEVASE